jgi:ubiquinone biosynthesis monooxygenase Coq7
MIGNYRKQKRLEEILRVNHSGELGAKYIYMGQAFILKNNAEIKEMLDQEIEHLNFFEEEIKNRNTRKSLLTPLWQAGGFALGVVSALTSKNNAMQLTEKVEEVIIEHYSNQIAELKEFNEPELAEKIEQFKNDEKNHQDKAIMEGAKAAFFYKFFGTITEKISKTAIKVAEKI